MLKNKVVIILPADQPKSRTRTLYRHVLAWLFLIMPQLGWAVNTASGTLISNTATLTYAIGAGPAITTTSNTVSFPVDKKINLLVTEVSGSSTAVGIGQSGAVTAFSVTNLGNDPQGFDLVAALASGNPASGGSAPFTTNNFSATGLQVFADANANGVYDAGVDTAMSIPTLAAGSSQTVFIVADIPGTVSTGQQSVVSLTAIAVAPTTMAALVATAGGNTAGVDVVFADGTGVVDSALDAKFSAYSAYLVNSVNLALTKTVVSVADPNGTAVLMPGAVITYRIIAALTGSGTANNLEIADPLPADTTYVPNSISVDSTAKTDAIDTDNARFSLNTVTVSLGNVAAPANIVITFRATIN